MSENYLFTVLIVNENFEIIDGQHRFEVIKELKLPLNYIVCAGYGLKEVHILNQITKTWSAEDYLDGYCNLNYPDYLQFRQFKEIYGFGHTESVSILTGSNTKTAHQTFNSGNFKVKNYKEACETAEKILLIAPYYEGYKRKNFIFTMLNLFKNPFYSHVEFLQKLKLQPSELMDCTRVTQYLSVIEKIYNYHRREKVNLRYCFHNGNK
jgi:hypothetical protein